jgi:hypothetical protein
LQLLYERFDDMARWSEGLIGVELVGQGWMGAGKYAFISKVDHLKMTAG